ncbi:MAG: hypothetical protein FGM15_08030 [Chthoniobacterales bacterium]|nr:hypothetical protein [Chthoniobacterales bacterium]
MRSFLLLLLGVSLAVAQEAPKQPDAAPAPQKTLRQIWGMTEAQYQLVDPSRRRNGDMFKYFRAKRRGPHGNMLEHIPGGPRRPVFR